MKKKIILAITACLFTIGSIINVHMAQNDHDMEFSLADISFMAAATTEIPEVTITCNSGGDGLCYWCMSQTIWTEYGWGYCYMGCQWSGYQQDSCESSQCQPGGCMSV